MRTTLERSQSLGSVPTNLGGPSNRVETRFFPQQSNPLHRLRWEVRMDSLGEVPAVPLKFSGTPTGAKSRPSATLPKNIALSLARVGVNSLVALVLPAYLTHHLPVATYGAWALILQLAAFVSFLDFGVQTGVAKFVAEYDARDDEAGAGRYASAGLAIIVARMLWELLSRSYLLAGTASSSTTMRATLIEMSASAWFWLGPLCHSGWYAPFSRQCFWDFNAMRSQWESRSSIERFSLRRF